ncbi:MAG TPA: adenylate/guanylate cyclase domain-containing protein [Actinomycetota bacterium]
MSAVPTLEAGREAIGRHAWREAYDLLVEAERDTPLSAADLDALADAAWWGGRMRDCIAARERAFQAYQAEGNLPRLMRAAAMIAEHYHDTHEPTIAGAWMQRATKLAEQHPDCAEAGYVRCTHAYAVAKEGDLEGCIRLSREAMEIGTRYGDRDVMAFALCGMGYAKVMGGEPEEGLALLDEATIAAVSGELGPLATGVTYCIMISACSTLADYQRAGQWSEAARRWCERQSIAGFPGVCRVHHAEVLRLRGSLADAETEARSATLELADFNISFAAEGFHELGEIRLRMGEDDGALDAFKQALELGEDPQPGFALLQLRQGKTAAAASSIRRSIEQFPPGLPMRLKLLPAQVEIALAAGDRVAAAAAAAELAETVGETSSVALRAHAEQAGAAVALDAGEVDAAVAGATRALTLWREADMPYEVAQARMLLAAAYAAEGDADAATLELENARAAFERLGAIPAATVATQRLDALTRTAPAVRAVKTFMFTDIVNSTKMLEALGDAMWANVIGFHDRTLRSLFADHRGEEIKHTGDGFFVAFDGPRPALDCAIAIQRALDDHRTNAGFAPQVRIGLHATEAEQVADDYRGRGVHESARIGAEAGADEILASVVTVAGCDVAVATSDARTVELKGFAEPIEVVSVLWREAWSPGT